MDAVDDAGNGVGFDPRDAAACAAGRAAGRGCGSACFHAGGSRRWHPHRSHRGRHRRAAGPGPVAGAQGRPRPVDPRHAQPAAGGHALAVEAGRAGDRQRAGGDPCAAGEFRRQGRFLPRTDPAALDAGRAQEPGRENPAAGGVAGVLCALEGVEGALHRQRRRGREMAAVVRGAGAVQGGDEEVRARQREVGVAGSTRRSRPITRT